MQRPVDIVFKLSESIEDAGGIVTLNNGSEVHLYGSSIPIIWDIQESLNLSFQLNFQDWTPAVAFVGNGTYDWGAPLMSLSENLVKEGLDAGCGLVFLHPLVAMTSNVYFRQPPSENIYITIFRPFQATVWIVFLFSMLLSSLLVYNTHLCKENVDPNQPEVDYPEKMRRTILLVILQMVYFLMGRYRKVVELKSRGTRVSSSFSNNESLHAYQYCAILVATYLSTFGVMAYTAKIAAIFARNESVIKSQEDLLKYDYSLSSYSELHFDKLFRRSNEVRENYKYKEKFFGGKDAVEKVVAPDKTDPRFAFLAHPDGFYLHARYSLKFTHEICTVSSFASAVKTPRSMFLKKGSPLRKRINLKIVQLIERGLNYRYQSTYNRQYEYKCTKEELGWTQLSNNHASFAFIILMTGACAAILIESGIYLKNLFYYKHLFLEYHLGIILNRNTTNTTNSRLKPLDFLSRNNSNASLPSSQVFSVGARCDIEEMSLVK